MVPAAERAARRPQLSTMDTQGSKEQDIGYATCKYARTFDPESASHADNARSDMRSYEDAMKGSAPIRYVHFFRS